MHMAIRSIGIVSKPRKEQLQQIVPNLLVWLTERGISTAIDEETAASLNAGFSAAAGVPVVSRAEICSGKDLILVLGGDGTLLSAARHVGPRRVPILAVNLGALGFLTAVTIDEMYSTLELVFKGQHQLDERKMLRVQVFRNGESIATFDALNDAVLNKTAIARILDFQASVDGRFLNFFKADGLIVSTPTGSTAYSLSAGGPIVHPRVDAFIITPICPHTLSNRPVVVSDQSTIEVVLKGEAESVFLTVDGQVGLNFQTNDRVLCGLSPNRVCLVPAPGKEFFEVLRNKLKWGER
jgi:NAD+ kinase